jgi:hypothetical protein
MSGRLQGTLYMPLDRFLCGQDGHHLSSVRLRNVLRFYQHFGLSLLHDHARARRRPVLRNRQKLCESVQCSIGLSCVRNSKSRFVRLEECCRSDGVFYGLVCTVRHENANRITSHTTHFFISPTYSIDYLSPTFSIDYLSPTYSIDYLSPTYSIDYLSPTLCFWAKS